MISQEKFHRLIKQEAIEDNIAVLVLNTGHHHRRRCFVRVALPMPIVWYLVAQNPVPPGQKRFRDLDEIRSDIESPSLRSCVDSLRRRNDFWYPSMRKPP